MVMERAAEKRVHNMQISSAPWSAATPGSFTHMSTFHLCSFGDRHSLVPFTVSLTLGSVLQTMIQASSWAIPDDLYVTGSH